MSTETLFVTASGRVVDIFAPTRQNIDFSDIAEHLAKEARYNGGTPGAFYSVAQHLVLGADFILALPGARDTPLAAVGVDLAAAYFLAHDFHEYVLKDETTPKKRALDRVAEEFGSLAGVISEAYARLVERWDNAIHEAAELPWPPPGEVRLLVDDIDKRLLLAEWAALHGGHQLIGDYSGKAPLKITIEPWSWETARRALEGSMRQLLPTFWERRRAAAPLFAHEVSRETPTETAENRA